VLRSHGLEGEIRVVPFSRELLNISVGGTVFIAERAHRVNSMREVPGGLILSTDQLRAREAADQVQGELLEVADEDLVPLEDGSYYVADLIGLTAVDETGEALGTVTEVMATGANDVYVVTTAEGAELLLPAIPDVVLKVDVDGGRMTVRPLDSASGRAIDKST
jgi:16S rRNA processing protein RimM